MKFGSKTLYFEVRRSLVLRGPFKEKLILSRVKHMLGDRRATLRRAGIRNNWLRSSPQSNLKLGVSQIKLSHLDAVFCNARQRYDFLNACRRTP
jgi:hypothetical protein